MLTYQGVPQDKIADSVLQARAFVETLGCDPIITGHMAQLTDDVIAAIRDAATHKDLVAAVAEVKSVFLFSGDLFAGHAIVNTGGQGTKVTYDLSAWGAFSGARHLVLTPLDVAIEQHLKTLPSPTMEQVNATFQNKPDQYISRYALVCDTSSKREALMNKVNAIAAVLQPFWDKGDEGSMRMMIGMLNHNDPDDHRGIVFETSLEAARAVAKAFPQDVIRHVEGWIVTPDAGDAPAAKTQPSTATPRPPRGLKPKP